MLYTLTGSALAGIGNNGGTTFTTSQGRPMSRNGATSGARSRRRTPNRWASSSVWRYHWNRLQPMQQALWNLYAESNDCWPMKGLAGSASGRQMFNAHNFANRWSGNLYIQYEPPLYPAPASLPAVTLYQWLNQSGSQVILTLSGSVPTGWILTIGCFPPQTSNKAPRMSLLTPCTTVLGPLPDGFTMDIAAQLTAAAGPNALTQKPWIRAWLYQPTTGASARIGDACAPLVPVVSSGYGYFLTITVLSAAQGQHLAPSCNGSALETIAPLPSTPAFWGNSWTTDPTIPLQPWAAANLAWPIAFVHAGTNTVTFNVPPAYGSYTYQIDIARYIKTDGVWSLQQHWDTGWQLGDEGTLDFTAL